MRGPVAAAAVFLFGLGQSVSGFQNPVIGIVLMTLGVLFLIVAGFLHRSQRRASEPAGSLVVADQLGALYECGRSIRVCVAAPRSPDPRDVHGVALNAMDPGRMRATEEAETREWIRRVEERLPPRYRASFRRAAGDLPEVEPSLADRGLLVRGVSVRTLIGFLDRKLAVLAQIIAEIRRER